MSWTNFEQKNHYYPLFKIYQNLLTKRQQLYFDLYINNDFTFEEMAQSVNVSRSAIFDSINKTIKLLDSYEKKLNLYEKYQNRQKIYQVHSNYEFIKALQEIDKI